MEAALDNGVRWVEFDVKLSADGVPYLMHDDTLDRTTDGKGPNQRRVLGSIGKNWTPERFFPHNLPLSPCRRYANASARLRIAVLV